MMGIQSDLGWSTDISAEEVSDSGPLERVHEVPLGGRAESTPEVVGGTAFCVVHQAGAEVWAVVAVDLSAGAVRWKALADGYSERSPVAAGDTVCFGTETGTAYCLRQAGGEVVWSRHICDSPIDCSIVVGGSLLLIGSYEGDLYALDVTTGEQRWKVPSLGGGGIVSSKPIVWHDSVLYCGWDEPLRCLDLKTGFQRWQLDVWMAADDHHTDPLLVEDLLFLPGKDGWMRAVDLTTREFAWLVARDWGALSQTPVALNGVLYYSLCYHNEESCVVCGTPLRPSNTLFPDPLLTLATGCHESYELSVHNSHLFCPAGPWLYVIEPRSTEGVLGKRDICKYDVPERFVTGMAHDGNLFCAGTATDTLLIGRLPQDATT